MPLPPPARPVVDDLIARGAVVVWLGGSHARNESHELSDVDLGAVGEAGAGPPYRLSMLGSHLVSVSWVTEGSVHAAFADPAHVGAAVPGWRTAELLHDPTGLGSRLQAAANSWAWQDVEADSWVAEQIVGLGEEVFKLTAARRANDRLKAGVQRSVLALRLAVALSVERRILYDSENRLWRLVSESMGEPWAAHQREALEGSDVAALAMYRIASNRVSVRLDARQRSVVDAALALIET